MNDPINPKHYKQEGKPECIDEIRRMFGDGVAYAFCLGNCWKYLYRNGSKEGDPKLQDLSKANWYLNYLKSNLSDVVCDDVYKEHMLLLYDKIIEIINEGEV